MMKKDDNKAKRGIGKMPREDEQGPASKPVTLAPLAFDEALDGLLAVKPEPKDEPKEAKKRTVKKTAKK